MTYVYQKLKVAVFRNFGGIMYHILMHKCVGAEPEKQPTIIVSMATEQKYFYQCRIRIYLT